MYTLTENYVIRADGACIPFDPKNRDYAEYLEWVKAGNVADSPPEPSIEEKIATNVAAIQSALDARSREKGYDNILSACTYAMQPEGAPFQAEGAAFVAWRTAVWAQAYAVLDQVKQGAPLPTPEQAVAQMPPL